MKLWHLLALAVGFVVNEAAALEFTTATIAGKKATVCRVDMKTDRLQLFLRDEQGLPLKSFEAIDRWLAPQGRKLILGMNAGMYHGNLAPVGLFIADGRQLAPLNLSKADGNFFLKPNGVFYITASGAHVVESSQFSRVTEPVTLATQSGPLLVIGGKFHPAFNAGSESRLFRNGVGVPSPDVALFVVTEEPFNFHEFATLFRYVLRCPDALFLDGTVCSLHSTALKRSEKRIDLGPIIGITEPIPASEKAAPAP